MTAPDPAARTIDVHAHLTPQAFWDAQREGRDWYGVSLERDDRGDDYMVVRGRRHGPERPVARSTPEVRIKEMDAAGTGMQVVSVTPFLYGYDLPADLAGRAAREINDEIASMVRAWPDRFGGLATLPLPDVAGSVAELERAVGVLGLAGAEVDTHVEGRAWDEPEFEPLFAAAERLEAILFFHPFQSLVWAQTARYHLGNSVGNPVEDELAIAALVFGGVLDRHPRLTALIAHGGGPVCIGIGRLDRGWQARPEARANILEPPSRYLRRLYYDCITWSEPALRLLIDTVGADRVVMGSDWPYDMGLESPTRWLGAMATISDEERDLILHRNAERLLGRGSR